MAFPTTGVLDTFSTGSAMSADWSADPFNFGGIVFDIISGSATTENAATYCAAYWDTASFGPASEVFCTIIEKPSAGGDFAIGVRIANPDSASASGYRVGFFNTVARVYRVDNATPTQLGADISVTVANGDKVGFEANGSTLTVYRDTGGGWTSIGSRSDSTYTAAGFISLEAYNGGVDNPNFDDFGGGTISGDPPTEINPESLFSAG